MLARFAFGFLPASLLLVSPLGAQAPSSSPPAAVKFSGYIQGRETYQQDIGMTGTINRARLTAAGSVPGNVTWRIQGEFRTGSVGTGKASVSLQDAYVRWTHNALGVQIGQFKTPFTREFITSLAEVETADRSTVVDSLAPKRDIGLMADYAMGGRATVSVGVFNGEGQNVTANRDSSALGIARVSVRPVPFLVLGTNAARYFQDSTRYGADASVESPWIVLRGEYVGQHHDQASSDDKGWYAVVAAPLRPWVQPVLKYEWFNRPSVALEAQKNRAWTAGVNLFPWGRATRLTLEYVSRKVGEPGVRKSLGLAQAQVIF
ncbi:MAG: OprO/OprP family phosphate-selective porin [Chloroflexota bacterium]|nr:OprO/OprP family phosphate-selective porin [Chloroflexota bacterium]